jgi:NAD(P)-dependent dehydrogenase (short-subunit alcohol dehydrogenase family)
VTFRDQLLSGRRVALAGGCGVAIGDQLRRLGAWVDGIDDAAVLAQDAAGAWIQERAPLHALVFDAGASFGAGGQAGLRDTMELAWLATRAVAAGALIPAHEGGKLLLIAPRRSASVHAEAARAAIENLARTLSVEWARFSISAVAVWPGDQTTDPEIAELACFLLSPGADYITGCRLDLGVAQDAHARPAAPR